MSEIRDLERDVLGRNNEEAAKTRAFLRKRKIYTVNLVSSPGAGKTSLLCATLEGLKPAEKAWVIVGDVATRLDEERLSKTGRPAVQIETRGACHLDAPRVRKAIDELDPKGPGILFIENVGNLVCPAGFDLGEEEKVVLLSLAEGEDKPAKYPTVFRNANVLVYTKVDLEPVLDFDMDLCTKRAKEVNGRLQILRTSVKGAPGIDEWLAWLRARLTA